MASFIRPNRTEVSRTFPWLGFTIRTAAAPAWFEVAIATDATLFDADAKSRRTSETFYSTRVAGPLPAPSGEAVWIVPPAVLARFAGKPQIYYALATFHSADRQAPEIVRVPAAAAPSVTLSRSFTGVTRRLAGVGGRGGDSSPDYGSSNGAGSLDWAGDVALVAAPAPAEPAAPAAAPAHTSALEFEYKDGFGPLPPPPDSHAEQGRHRYPAQALGDAIDIYWSEVESIGQPTNVSCWAAAAAMVVGFRDRISIDPSEFARLGGRWTAYNQNGLSTNDNAQFAAAWRLEAEPPADPSVDGFARMLQNKGPLWIGRHPTGNDPGMGHAVAVIGLHGDGTPDGTFVHWHDPWPPGSGTPNKTETYTTFLQEFDDFITVDQQGHVNTQILHATDTGGRTPGHVPATSSQSVAVQPFAFDAPPVTRSTDSSGDLTWTLESWDGMKYPPGVAGGSAPSSPKRVTVAGPRYAAFGIDNIYANLDLDFQYDGRGVGKVALRMGEHSDAVTKGLHVNSHIVDDARTFQGPSGQTFAGIRISIDYSMTQVVADDVQAQIDVMLYGSGDYDVRYHMVQGSFDTMPSDVVSGVTPAATPARAQAIALEGEGGGAGVAIAGQAVGSLAGEAVMRIVDNLGDLTIAHESWNGMKYPPGVPRGNAATTPKQITIQGPRYDALYVDSIYCDLAVDFEYDGRGVGKVAMRAGARSDAVGKGLNIQAHIVDDARTFTGGSGGPSQTFAGIRITLEYSFTQTIADDIVVHAQAMLYGNGDYDVEYHLIQGSVDTMPPAVTSGVHATASPSVPQQAQSLGGDTDVLRSIGGFIVDHFNPTEDGITADLEQWPKRSDRQIGGAKKFPFDDQSQVGDGATQHQQITVTCPHSTSGNFCDLVVSWDYNGRWLTNVDIAKGHAHGVPVLERLDYKYSVTAQIEDIPNAAYTPRDAPQTPACAALRVNIEWYETRPVVENTLCRCVLTIFANGAWQADYSLLSGEVEDPGVAINFIGARPPMRSVGTGQAQSLADPAPSPVTHSSETRGAVRFELDQFTGMKQPANVAPSGTPAQTATVRIGGPRATAATGGEESYADCEIAYDYDGRGVGNVHVRPTTTGGTAALVVAETIGEDSQLYALPGSTDPLAALKLHFEYRFDSTRPLKTDVTLYGNGRQDIHYDWSQV